MSVRQKYELWLRHVKDGDLQEELYSMKDSQIEDSFYRDLSFGTGGLRGIIGAGTNRMNIYTVAKASQGLANYLANRFGQASVVIGYDSRINSDVFARVAAEVFAANGAVVHIWPQLTPVPTVSFAVRHLCASAGVMITASHNPAQYNGYKVYGADGCQITTTAAKDILREIEALDIFSDVKRKSYEHAVENGEIQYIPDEVMTAYLSAVKAQSILYGDTADKTVSIVYSPLNGTGLAPVTRALRDSGFGNVFVVPEQQAPDGKFPTCPYPNPEERDALALGIHYAEEKGAELVLATDPDCDRVGIAVRDGESMVLLTGNEVGLLLIDYICSQRLKHGTMPVNPVMVKTIVTSDLAERIAIHYGVETINVLTGFKYIGEQIGLLEHKGEDDRFIFGFEESYGYLSGTYVRDKDGVNGALLICEMLAYHKAHGKGLITRLQEIYGEYGYSLNTLHSYQFEGAAGMEKMRAIMSAFRDKFDEMGGRKIIDRRDYLSDSSGLPKSDVLKFALDDSSTVVIRPSGTEPKLKVYFSAYAENETAAAYKL